MKKSIKIICCICIILTLHLFILLPVSAAETYPLTFKTNLSIYKYSEFDNSEFNFKTNGDDGGYTRTLDPMAQFWYAPVFYTSDDSYLKQFYTYHIKFSFNIADGFHETGTFSYIETYLCDRSTDFADFLVHPRSYPKVSSFTDSSFLYTAASSGTATLDIVFYYDGEEKYNVLAPMVYCINRNSDSAVFNVSSCTVEAYYDYDQTTYQAMVYNQQTAIKNAIEEGFADTNASLEEINNTLTGDGEYTPPDPELDSSISDLSDKEDELNELITAPIELPDGTVIQTDANSIENIKLYIKTAYNAPEYDKTAGQQYTKVFEVFMPYLGTVVFLSLFLGLGIAFLTGRRLN